MPAVKDADTYEYLSQLVDRFCKDRGPGSPLALWAMWVLSAPTASQSGRLGASASARNLTTNN